MKAPSSPEGLQNVNQCKSLLQKLWPFAPCQQKRGQHCCCMLFLTCLSAGSTSWGLSKLVHHWSRSVAFWTRLGLFGDEIVKQ